MMLKSLYPAERYKMHMNLQNFLKRYITAIIEMLYARINRHKVRRVIPLFVTTQKYKYYNGTLSVFPVNMMSVEIVL